MCSFFLLVHVLFFSFYRNIRRRRDGSSTKARRLVFTSNSVQNPESLQDLAFKILRANTIPPFFLQFDTPEKFNFQEILILLRFSASVEDVIDSGHYPATGYLSMKKIIEHWYSGCFREIRISFIVSRRGKHFLKNVSLDIETSPKGVLESDLFCYFIKKNNM